MSVHTILITFCHRDPVTEAITSQKSFTLPLDASDPKAWQDLLNYIIAHPELIIALLQLIAMLLGGITPPPKPAP
jgi:hypothetical protein